MATFETSTIRSAPIDKGIRLSRGETGRVVQWLTEYSQVLGAFGRGEWQFQGCKRVR
jgi:hypothetical protein